MTHLVFSFCYLLSLCFWNHLEGVLLTIKILSCTVKLLVHTSLTNSKSNELPQSLGRLAVVILFSYLLVL